ncbi:hypothetical protein DPEC_G00031920 [Dallia pectoralis]|uniref:Uncharacterized protein n=1 Tax=Dallia pectoralis TaxID=75939 RepID=A0ACC2HD66_DALPE|nr:hypothetical protein DPEC_G00031920 [Dallia pectoralis]
MDDYNEFCSRAMVHLQREQVRRNPLLQPEGAVVSRIQFHGRPILLPWLNKDQHKQMVQYKQQVAVLEAERQRLHSTSLLARVQDILHGVKTGPTRLEHMTESSSSEPGTFFSDDEEEQEAETGESCPCQSVSFLGRSEPKVRVFQGDPGPWEECSFNVDRQDHKPGFDVQDGDSLVSSVAHSPVRYQHASYPSSPDSLLGSNSHSLTGSYVRLPSPQARPNSALSSSTPDSHAQPVPLGNPDHSPAPVVHGQRLSPTPASNILISCPMSAADLSPLATRKGQVPGRRDSLPVNQSSRGLNLSSNEELSNTPFHSWKPSLSELSLTTTKEEVSRSDTNASVPGYICRPENLSSTRERSSLRPILTCHSQCPQPISGPGHTSFQSPSRTRTSQHQPSLRQSPHHPNPCLRSSGASQPPHTPSQSPMRSSSPQQTHRSPLASLNRSYDVESPRPNLSRPHVTSESWSGLSHGLHVRQDMSLEDRLSIGLSTGRVQHSRRDLSTPEASCDGSRLTLSFLDSSRTADQDRTTVEIQRQVEALEEMRRCLEEEHALQLSLLLSEQQRQQRTLTQTMYEERGLRRSETTVPPCGAPGIIRVTRADAFEASVLPPFSFTSLRLGGRSSNSRLCPEPQRALGRLAAVVRGFFTRRLLHTEKVKQLRKTVQDTLVFIGSLSTDSQKKRSLSPQVRTLQERGRAQLRAALFDVHEIFFVVPVRERLALIQQDRELRTERTLRDMEKESKSPRDKVVLSAATQKSLERKKQRMMESLRQGKKSNQQPKSLFTSRILQPSQDHNTILSSNLSRLKSGNLLCKNESILKRFTVT